MAEERAQEVDPPADPTLSVCGSCERLTRTVVGRCPDCGAPKGDLSVSTRPYIRHGVLDADDFAFWLVLTLFPSVGLVVALVLFGWELALGVAVLAALLVLAVRWLQDGT
jgi:hypothetical protein